MTTSTEAQAMEREAEQARTEWPREIVLPQGVTYLSNSAYQIDRAILESRCGFALNPRAWDLRPGGARLVVGLVPDEERFGSIVLPPPEGYATSKKGSGWVIYAGPEVGGVTPYPGGIGLPAWEIPGRFVLFGRHLGEVIQMTYRDDEWKSQVLLISERDVWSPVENPQPWTPDLKDDEGD